MSGVEEMSVPGPAGYLPAVCSHTMELPSSVVEVARVQPCQLESMRKCKL